VPEIEGDGAMFGGKGVIYSIPVQQPELKMKLLSQGMEKAPANAHLPSGSNVLRIGMNFKIANPQKTGQVPYLDPKEVILVLSEKSEFQPILVHSNLKKESIIHLTGKSKIAVELFYSLPNQVSEREIQFFSLRWKIHYGKNGSEQQLTRFDRRDSAPQGTGAFPDDPSDMGLTEVGFPVGFFDYGDWWAPY
jgi:hypothetical protein